MPGKNLAFDEWSIFSEWKIIKGWFTPHFVAKDQNFHIKSFKISYIWLVLIYFRSKFG